MLKELVEKVNNINEKDGKFQKKYRNCKDSKRKMLEIKT